MNMKTLIAICIVCLCVAVMPSMAQENNTTANETNVTETPTIEQIPEENTTETVVSETVVSETVVSETVVSEPAEAKFRVGPTVTLRPVNDVIDKSQDGLVELYINNPSLNDVTLTADVQISVPSGIHVYGEGFGYGGAAGTVAGKFEVPPGTVRTIHLNIKSEKTGDFTVHFTGLYWPGDDKDAYQQISLTHPLTVNEPSVNPTDSKPVDESNQEESNPLPLPSGFLAVIALAFVALVIRKSS
ncbi:MAG TPA: hypothetical protein C5S51_01670 [Methanosarcinaceae archaeon]|nr:hypothetical protein [Methanosarcinaceae archaeon]